MKGYQIPFGKDSQKVEVDEARAYCDLILPNATQPAVNPQGEILSALESPCDLDHPSLGSGTQVAIAINDKTRPVPHDVILPVLMTWLEDHGVPATKIKFWIATGSHTPMGKDEFKLIVPQPIMDRYAIESHDVNHLDNLIFLGTTSRGTPVSVNKQYYQADFKIVIGDIEPHHFAGFSGGYKTAAIGLAGRETINQNHALLTDPNSWIGIYAENPLRQDINEIGRRIGVDFAVNTVLNAEKKVVACYSGHPDVVMQHGIPRSREVCGTPIKHQYDVVIASAGGHPKDINFYQAQKALTHASLFCKPGGTIILSAACPEGSGSVAYEEFMQGISSVRSVYEKFSKMEFRVGPHKAYQVARLLDKYRIVLVSQIPADLVGRLLMDSAASIQQAFDRFAASQTQPYTVAILPHATTTLPA